MIAGLPTPSMRRLSRTFVSFSEISSLRTWRPSRRLMKLQELGDEYYRDLGPVDWGGIGV